MMNKKGYMGTFNIINIIFVAALFSAPFIYLMMLGGTITIERPYHRELQECNAKLTNEIAKNTPECSPCMPIKDTGYWFFYILGLLTYLGSIYYLFASKNKLDKREKELKEKENKLDELVRKQRKR